MTFSTPQLSSNSGFPALERKGLAVNISLDLPIPDLLNVLAIY